MNRVFSQPQPERVKRQSEPRLLVSPAAAILDGLARATVSVDWARREIRHCGGRRCKLSTLETALLACLARKVGTPVSRDEILSQVWRLDPRRTATRTIDMHISLLRRKLNEDAHRPSILLTVHGVGYMLHPSANWRDDVPPATGPGEHGPWNLITGTQSLSVG